MLKKIVRVALTSGAALLLLLQLVPYGRDHRNPPVIREPRWDRPLTRKLSVDACFDCHSNETSWPWYSHVAPISWLVQRDVEVGRRVMNFSEWQRTYEEAGESAQTVVEGTMPPSYYTLMHPAARLSSEGKKSALVRGLRATLGPTPEHE